MDYRKLAIAAGIISPDNPAKIESLRELAELQEIALTPTEILALEKMESDLKNDQSLLSELYPSAN